jgi:uncharacterized metal-binding protein
MPRETGHTMPRLPQRKVGVVACSGEELPEGTVTRLAALKVLEELRPSQTVTICLPLFLAGGEGDRAFARFYPTIAVDGCEKRCAARATELYSNKPAASFVVDDIVMQRGLAQPSGARYPSAASRAAVDALAEDIAAEVDHLIAVRWSRKEGAILEAEETSQMVNTAACACGSGIPVTTVLLDGRSVQIMALAPILELAYGQGLRAGGPVPAQIMETVHVYNVIPAEDDALWAGAVALAWQEYCSGKEVTAMSRWATDRKWISRPRRTRTVTPAC